MDNREKLRRIMAFHGLTAEAVGKLIHRNTGTVRLYMCGARKISDMLLEILEEKVNSQSTERSQYALPA